VVVGAYVTAKALACTERKYFWPALAFPSLALNLPYRWLWLSSLDYYNWSQIDYGREKQFVPEWLGRGRPFIPWNSTDTLLLAMLTATTLGWLALRRNERRCAGLGFFRDRRAPRLFLALFAIMTIEAWLHISNRSPYTYISHFEKPDDWHYVYASQMLPDGRGAVNTDYGYFVGLEELFRGHNPPGPPMLFVRRPFVFYLSSHLSYFIGPYHACLILNLLYWLGAALAFYFFVRDISGSTLVAVSAAGFIACAPGFVMYVAQPMSYLPGFAMLAIAVFLYHRLVATTQLASLVALAAAGILFGVTLLTYDTFAWALFFIAYAWLAGVSTLRALGVVLIGGGIYALYLLLVFRVFHLPPDHSNDFVIGEAREHLIALMHHPVSGRIFDLCSGYASNYCLQVVQTNFYIPAILAVLGLFLTSAVFNVRATALALLLPSAAGFAYLYFGQSFLAAYSRFNYPAYLGVVLLAALAVGSASSYLLARRRRKMAVLALALPFLACAALANLDAFGFMPHLYFHFYFSSGGIFGR